MDSSLIYVVVALLIIAIVVIVLLVRRRQPSAVSAPPVVTPVVADLGAALEVEIPDAAAGRLHRLRVVWPDLTPQLGKACLRFLAQGI